MLLLADVSVWSWILGLVAILAAIFVVAAVWAFITFSRELARHADVGRVDPSTRLDARADAHADLFALPVRGRDAGVDRGRTPSGAN